MIRFEQLDVNFSKVSEMFINRARHNNTAVKSIPSFNRSSSFLVPFSLVFSKVDGFLIKHPNPSTYELQERLLTSFFPEKVDGFHDSQPNPSTVEFRGLFRPAFSLKKSMDFTKLTQIHRLFIFLARRVLLRSYSAPQTGLEAFCVTPRSETLSRCFLFGTATIRPVFSKQGSTCFRFAKPHRVAAATPAPTNMPPACLLYGAAFGSSPDP